MIREFDTHDYDRFFSALVTPFKPDSLEIDEDAFRGFVRYFTQDESFIASRGALIANPEASEMFYMTEEERGRLLDIVMQERPQGMPVFAGCFGVSLSEIARSAEHAKSYGVDGLFVMPPVGTMEVSTALNGVTNPEVWTNHLKFVAEASDLPLIPHAAHVWTKEWGAGLPGPTVQMVLDNVPSVVGWKMIYGSNAPAHFRAARIIRAHKRHVAILNAPHYCYHTALMCDLLDGAVWGSYNFNKEGLVQHLNAWNAGDIPEAKRTWNRNVMPVHNFIYADPARLHIRYKLATWIRGLIAHPFMRPPMQAPRREEAEQVFDLFAASDLSCISKDDFETAWSKKDAILATAR